MRDERKMLADDSARNAHAAAPAQARPTPTYWQKLRQRWPVAMAIGQLADDLRKSAVRLWKSPLVLRACEMLSDFRAKSYSGLLTLIAGSAIITVLVWLSGRFFPVPNLGAAFVPLIAMLAYYWRWRLAIAGCVVQVLAVYLLVLPPSMGLKMLDAHTLIDLLVLAGISFYVLLLVMLARNRRYAAEREVTRFAALNAVGTALSGELQEKQLLDLIARTACELTGAGFAAFTLRPVDAMGKPVGPSEGSLFHLAAVVGVTPEEEELFRRVPLGGEGLLAPIFRNGVTVRVDDALELLPPSHHRAVAHPGSAHMAGAKAHADGKHPMPPATHDDSADHAHRESPRDAARRVAASYAHGTATSKDLRAVGSPRGHPVTRSFLGAPLLDREGSVRGGLLLGHTEPNRFTADDETLLKALAAQAAVTLDNARLYHNAQSQAEELNAVFESISDAVMVYNHQGDLLHENHSATNMRDILDQPAGGSPVADVLNGLTADHDSIGSQGAYVAFSLPDIYGETREYVVNVSPLQALTSDENLAVLTQEPDAGEEPAAGGTVVVWHEVTETRKLLAEQQARAEADSRRLLLQKVIDELPSGVYLVRGRDAKLVLANNAAHEVWGAHWTEGQPMAEFLRSSGTQIVGSNGRLLEISDFATVQALRTGGAIHHYEEVIRRPDGTSLPVLLNAVALDPHMLEDTSLSLVDGAQPSPERLALVVLQDVTAMKEAERVKDEFIAIAAHELKTPMAAVKGYADMLVRQTQREGGVPLEPWQIEALETIDQATNRLVELTEDLLDVARLQAERIQLHIEPHDLIALVRRVVKRFKMASERHTLSLVTSDEFVVALLDVRRTEQIVGNLLSNAIKYSPDGGPIKITIEQDEGDQLAKLAVQDHGIGIPANQQAILFNRFARADNAREHGISGTGLGLYLCRELVELQGGHLWFESQEDDGSTFFVTLPLAEESA